MIKATTKSGSVYLIDTQAKTWARVTKTEQSGHVRTNDGEYQRIDGPSVGEALTLVCDPLPNTAALFRVIQTSDVVNVEEVIQTPKGELKQQ